MQNTRYSFSLAIFIVIQFLSYNSLETLAQNQTKIFPIPEFKKIGTGSKTLLLIPCMSCRWEEWEDFMERNKDRYTMYAITVPGNGGTPVPNLPKNTSQPLWQNNVITALSQFIDNQKLKDITIIGHSWGSPIAVQIAVKRPDVIKRLINIDGGIEDTSWKPKGAKAQLTAANQVVETWSKNLADVEQWRQFNAVSPPRDETISRQMAIRWIKLHGSFMATSKDVVFQYWRENFLVDLTGKTQSLQIPILDVKCLNGDKQDVKRQSHLENLTKANIASRIKTVFLFDTNHFVMFHRPQLLDQVINDFLDGKEVSDFTPQN